ncbi:hypothetical protein L195_g059130, partial [Trifolium pratense]
MGLRTKTDPGWSYLAAYAKDRPLRPLMLKVDPWEHNNLIQPFMLKVSPLWMVEHIQPLMPEVNSL